jgi:hypothetical protein
MLSGFRFSDFVDLKNLSLVHCAGVASGFPFSTMYVASTRAVPRPVFRAP